MFLWHNIEIYKYRYEEQEDRFRESKRWRGKIDAVHSLCQLSRLEEAAGVRHRYRLAKDNQDAAQEGHGSLPYSRPSLRGSGFRRAGSRRDAAAHGLGCRH